jgi:hypothetical protein
MNNPAEILFAFPSAKMAKWKWALDASRRCGDNMEIYYSTTCTPIWTTTAATNTALIWAMGQKPKASGVMRNSAYATRRTPD